MTIISVSLPEEMAGELDRLQQVMGTGRSEVVRAGIREISRMQRQQLDGRNSAVLAVTHKDRYDREVADIKEGHEDLIKTHTHNKIDADRCVEVFLLDGSGAEIKTVANTFLANKKMDNVDLVIL